MTARRSSRGNSSSLLRRRKCHDRCICLCHDTQGGIKDQHLNGQGPCPGKLACPRCGAAPARPCKDLPIEAGYHEERVVFAGTWTATNEKQER